MKVIIAGSRSITSYRKVKEAIQDSGFDITEVVSGAAPGVDHLAIQWANQHAIDLVIFPANWKRWSKQAGHLRNQKMAEYADALIAVWDGKSRGTVSMIKAARDRRLHVFIYTTSPDEIKRPKFGL